MGLNLGRRGAQRLGLRAFLAGTLTLGFALISFEGAAVEAGASADRTIAPGESITLKQSVDTPFVPPKPDIVLVIDRTGSMGPAITDVKSNIAYVIATIQATEPDAQFAAVAYCDSGEATPAFSTVSPLSANASAVIDAVIAMPLCYGGDLPEAQLDALRRVGERGQAIAFRPNSNRIVAWFGDAPGHLRGASLDGAISSLKGAKARVVAVSVGRNQLDATGQASKITRATGGTLLSDVASNNVAASLLQGLTSLPVSVTAESRCDDGLVVEAITKTETVESGTAAVFDETVTVAPTAEPGTKLTCRVTFSVDSRPMGSDYVQEISVIVGPEGSPGDVGTTDPDTTEPDATDPDTSDPGTSDPGTSDPGTSDPGTSDPGTSDPDTTSPESVDLNPTSLQTMQPPESEPTDVPTPGAEPTQDPPAEQTPPAETP